MTRTSGSCDRRLTCRAVQGLVLLSLASGIALAQETTERRDVAESPASAAPAPASPPQSRPGLLESFGRFLDQSVASIGKGFENAWRGAASQGDSAARASSEATANLAKGAVDAARGTADALGKIGTPRMVTGRERCAISANGSPDCRPAVEKLCKSKGLNAGNSVDFETSERCPAQVLLSGRKQPGDCVVEHVVTKAMCQ
jgi:hypothetical protein